MAATDNPAVTTLLHGVCRVDWDPPVLVLELYQTPGKPSDCVKWGPGRGPAWSVKCWLLTEGRIIWEDVLSSSELRPLDPASPTTAPQTSKYREARMLAINSRARSPVTTLNGISDCSAVQWGQVQESHGRIMMTSCLSSFSDLQLSPSNPIKQSVRPFTPDKDELRRKS